MSLSKFFMQLVTAAITARRGKPGAKQPPGPGVMRARARLLAEREARTATPEDSDVWTRQRDRAFQRSLAKQQHSIRKTSDKKVRGGMAVVS